MEPPEYATMFALEERHFWYRGLRRLVEDQVGRVARNGASPLRILDAGCGTGGMTQRLALHGRVTALDYSPLALDLARQRGSWGWTRGSVERLPYRSEIFDIVVSLDVLYHRGVESDLAALREFRRCLRPGGSLILNLPAFEWLRSTHDEAVHTARRYRRGPLAALLRDAGLVPDRLTHWNTALFPGLAVLRWLRRRTSRSEPHSRPGDVQPLPATVNGLLGAVLGVERAWMRWGDLPTGVSILAVAHRPSPTGS